MKNNYYQSPKPSWLMRQFWKAAGADEFLLRRSTYSDQVKYFCMGGIVIATGVMAAMAGGYAIYTIFEPKGLAMDNYVKEVYDLGDGESIERYKQIIHMPTLYMASAFGVIWGLIIFNIDRFIVTSTGKGDGTEAITGQEFRSAIPRIIMGIIIALTISKPIEIRMFQSEIDVKLFEIQQADALTKKENVKKKFNEEFDKIDTEEKEIDARLAPFIAEESRAREDLRDCMMQYGSSACPRNKELYNQAKANLEKEQNKMAPKIGQLNTRRTKLQLDYDKQIADGDKSSKGLDGLLQRLKLAHEVAGPWISLFITLLFIVIELTPIFFKMMLIKGPYDYMDENVKELARAEAGIEIIYNYYEDGQGMEAHKVVNHGAELKSKERLLLLKAQEELNEKIIDSWKKKKLKEIDNNPDEFITEG